MIEATDPLAFLAQLASEVVPVWFDPLVAPDVKNALLLQHAPDVLACVGALQAKKDAQRRAEFVAHHAVLLAQTAVETSVDDAGLRDAARRAVRLSQLIWDTAHGGAP